MKQSVNLKNFLNLSYTIAIVGASNNPTKYGNKVYKDLKNAGYHVIPINLTGQQIDGDSAYSQLSDYPDKIDVVCIVVPPKITLQILKEALQLQISKIWLQPGSANNRCIQFAKQHNLQIVYNQCIMLNRLNVSTG